MAKQPQTTILEQVYDYQTRLQGVANDLAVKLAAVATKTNNEVAKFIANELPWRKRSIKAELDRMNKLIAKVEEIRKPTYDAAKDLILSTSADVLQSGTDETAKEFNMALGDAARKEREKRFCKTLTPQQQKAILDGQSISGATIADWFHNWRRKDLETISSACQRASVEELTVRDIYRLIRGTKENNYTDGVLATTQAGAVTLARTIINGVSNNARVETIKENADVIDGVKFLGTLDGKTCPYCASLDGYIWRGEDMGQARRPPIHPNCRCTLIPYVELKDDEGNVVDVDSERPAANADFDQLAKEAYNDAAKQKGWNRRWDDLAPSTRLKYYYQAQKDFEARTGKKAYEQVPASLTFADYFKKQDDQFKRSWLGAKRFELYKDGKLKEDQIFAPNLGYMATATELFHISKETQQTASELETLAKEGGEKIKQVIDAQKEKQVGENIETGAKYSTPVYKEEEILFSVKTDTFQHDFKYSDRRAANSDFNAPDLTLWKDIEATREAFLVWKDSYSKKIKAKEPKRADYISEDVYEKDWRSWGLEASLAEVFDNVFEFFLHRLSKETKSEERAEKTGEEVSKVKPEPTEPIASKDIDKSQVSSQNKEAEQSTQYQWVDIVWNSEKLGRSFSENDVVTEQDFVPYDENILMDVLFVELPAFYFSILKEINENKPQKAEYSSSADYKADLGKWQDNKKSADAFTGKVGKLIDSAKRTSLYQAQKEALNNAPEIIFRSPIGGTFTPDNADELPEKLRDQSIEGFDQVEHYILVEVGAWLAKFDADVGSPPERRAFRDDDEHQEALNAYKTERAKGEAFFTKLLQLLREEKARRSAADPVYKPVKIAWKTPFGEWGEV